MKKILAIILAALLLLSCFSGCNNKKESDWDYIKNKGELIVGITLFAPMNYYDNDNKLTGFETEFAEAVAEKLGIKVKFQTIDWEAKETELNARAIDCIWNGMTIDDEKKANMEISNPYMSNKQVVVVKSENMEKYSDVLNINGVVVVAESGSAGEKVATKDETFSGADFVPVEAQSNVLMEVLAGTAEIGLIDYVMSIGSIGEGTDFADLKVIDSLEFSPEEYGIAFRKGSNTAAKVNKAMSELASEGFIKEIAEKYMLQDLILIK